MSEDDRFVVTNIDTSEKREYRVYDDSVMDEARRHLDRGKGKFLLHLPGRATPALLMPVPRCETCRWWDRIGEDPQDRKPRRSVGMCRLHSRGVRRGEVEDNGFGLGYPGEPFETQENFGCVQWEAKGGRR